MAPAILTIVAALWAPTSSAQTADGRAEAALRAVRDRVPAFQAVTLPAAGELRLEMAQSLTVDDLRGVALDDDPPAMGAPAQPYPAEHTDGFAAGEAPYWAPGIEPFRLREFTAEFNYGGWHNFNMFEYAATHGFSVLAPYVLPATAHFPAGTQWLQWGTFIDWHAFFGEHGLQWGRFDQLADLDVTQELLNSGKVWEYGPDRIAMVDLEHGGALSPEELRGQGWYPRDAPEAERAAFEQRYYGGYLKTYTAPIEALRRRGWTSVGVYPQPYGSGWFALLGLAEKGLSGLPDPTGYWPWLTYGRAMHDAQDILYPDIYVYYWSPQNVAYTLARIDFDRRLLGSLPEPRPYRPYFWPLLHGGDADPHWWAQQPLPTEDERAIFALAFFAGCDGVVLWNWSDVGNHHVPPPLWRAGATTAVGDRAVEGGIGADVMVGEGFELLPEGVIDGVVTRIRRYDVLPIVEVNEATGVVRFQHIDTRADYWGARLREEAPTYAMPRDQLLRHLRAPSEPVAGAVEGLALVKAFEPFLRHGEAKADVPSLDQFARTLPIVRRVKLGGYHLLATYDPLAVRAERSREVVLNDFDGRDGLTLALPADSQVRVFAVRARPEEP
ncbi:MAG: hypothetical protein FJX74_15730 [Armatimonadetes bacterium]|nr:hypothetical protein [Armatimonadota bacterium]